MGLLKRVPLYAVGLGFMVAVVALAEALDWNGWTILGVALGVGTFYITAIFVPWLVYDQAMERRGGHGGNGARPSPAGNGQQRPEVLGELWGAFVPTNDDAHLLDLPRTHGPPTVRQAKQQPATR